MSSIKYYQYMMKHRSSVESSISEYFFAVYPLSLHFERECTSKLHLYFQKGLQIISKHESPRAQTRKDQIVLFPQPEEINYFRIQSQKSIDYQWSLYTLLEDNDEEFMESQKITLKEAWSVYKTRAVSYSQQNISFNAIRCKLNYLVVIGNTNREILDLAQKYFSQSKVSVITTDQKLASLPVKVEGQKAEEPQSGNITQQPSRKAQQNVNETAQNGVEKVTGKRESVEEMKISDIIAKGRSSLQSQTSNKNAGQLITPREQQNPKLSTSQLDIGKQIQEKVNVRQDNLKGQTILLPEQGQKVTQTGDQAKVVQAKVVQTKEPGKEAVQGEETNIKLTNSQILNSNKEVVLPIYKQKKFIIAFLALIVLMLGTGFFVLGRDNPVIPEETKSKKTKKAQENKKQTTKSKKTKGKK